MFASSQWKYSHARVIAAINQRSVFFFPRWPRSCARARSMYRCAGRLHAAGELYQIERRWSAKGSTWAKRAFDYLRRYATTRVFWIALFFRYEPSLYKSLPCS